MLVRACTQKERMLRRRHVFARERGEMPLHRHFTGMVWQAPNWPVQPRLGRHINEQIINRFSPDGAKHRLSVGWG